MMHLVDSGDSLDTDSSKHAACQGCLSRETPPPCDVTAVSDSMYDGMCSGSQEPIPGAELLEGPTSRSGHPE